MPLPEGSNLGRYEVRSLLGVGGMGEVYLAYDRALHRRVALKVIRDSLTTHAENLERFEREAYAASSLNHPNILTIHEIGQEDDCRFMVTEFVEGESLRQHLRREPFTVQDVLDAGVQIAAALAAAHAAGIVHRDIKPDNLMLRQDGLIKVLDFGLAKLTEQRDEDHETSEYDTSQGAQFSTRPGIVMGTVRYMSPEQARGLPVDARTDIWSLGVVLYEMVAGRTPFAGDTTSDVIVAVLSAQPAPLTSFSTDVPDELERIIRKALYKEKEQRYQKVSELEQDLRRLKRRLEFDADLLQSGRRSGQSIWPAASPEDGQTEAAGGPQLFETAPMNASVPAGATSASGSKRNVTSVGPEADTSGKLSRRRHLIPLAVAVMVALAGAFGIYYWTQRQAPPLAERDVIVLADFANSTGDAVFDETLSTALKVSLRQSPFLNVLSDGDVAKTLQMMTRPTGTKLTPDVASDLGQRAGAKAYIAGSIASIGSQYVLSLRAVNCRSGDTLAEEQVTASSKETVLDGLGKAASRLRSELGESLATVQRFDVPLAQATTPSLEALQSYSLARIKMTGEGGAAAAVPLYRRAIQQDAKFAMAYALLGATYSNLREGRLANESIAKAYEWRERVSERERYYIEGRYYYNVTGDIEKARQVFELWSQTYLRDEVPHVNLGACYVILGQYEKALAESIEVLRLNPNALYHALLVSKYVNLSRLDEARTKAEEALAGNLDSPFLRLQFYTLEFLKNDVAGMARQVVWSTGKSGVEDQFLGAEADTAAYYGRLKKAREFSRRAVAAAERAELKEAAANYESNAALREAILGMGAEARQHVAAALALSDGRKVQGGGALTLALAGDSARARSMAEDLGKRFPDDTTVRFNFLPTINAQLALNRGDAANALEALKAAAPYELGHIDPTRLFPVYLRGVACLAAKRGVEAAVEFRKILDHRGLMGNSLIAALAHLQIGRAYALQGDTAKARSAYQEFLNMWKDADPDLSILTQARAEYEKVK